MNTTLTDIMTRRSVRSFASRPIDRENLEAIIAAGLAAPSAHGQQSRHIAVIEDLDLRKRIKSAMQWFKPVVEAPVAFLVCGDIRHCTQEEYWTVDCSTLAENMLIAARALGLGTCWCGISPAQDNVKAIRSVLDIPEGLIPFCMIAVGYPKDEGAFREKKLKGADSFVTWNPDWGKAQERVGGH